jgi:16S rRNA (uracil1498-N3)-methyltransferase
LNLLLLEAHELDGGRAVVRGRRAAHLLRVHRVTAGRVLKAGMLGGRVGEAVVVEAHADEVTLDVALHGEPPAPLPCLLVLALPRPKVLRRVLGAATTFGIKRIVLVGASRVEKSYWQSPMLDDTALRETLLLGLEQAGDTAMPSVERRTRFRPFVEDELAGIAAGSDLLVAHPGAGLECPRGHGGAVTLVVGPEGGFIPFELDLLATAGARAVSLGPRPLRVEQALAALLGRLF